MRHSPVYLPRPSCPHRRLRYLVAQTLGSGLALLGSGFRPWASANFVGARHVFDCQTKENHPTPSRVALEQQLLALEWPLAGHIVADVAVVAGKGREYPPMLSIEILTVED